MYEIEQRIPTRLHGIPCADYRTASFDKIEAAEKSARIRCKRNGHDVIIRDAKTRRQIAVVVKDALDRVWTEVCAAPGQPTVL